MFVRVCTSFILSSFSIRLYLPRLRVKVYSPCFLLVILRLFEVCGLILLGEQLKANGRKQVPDLATPDISALLWALQLSFHVPDLLLLQLLH